MTATFYVSATQFRFVSEFTLKNPLLLVRFAPNPEVSGHRNYSEWQIDVEGNIAAYLNVPEGTKGKECVMMADSNFNVPSYMRDDEVKKLIDETPISTMLPGPIGLIVEDLLPYATPLMHELIEAFRARGLKVVALGEYDGSFGPSHFLRDGVIYKRRH